MVMEGASLETRHRNRLFAGALLLTRVQFGAMHRAQTGMKVHVQLRLGAGLAIAQARKLLGIAEYTLHWNTRLVSAIESQGLQVNIGAKEDRLPMTRGIDHNPHLEVAFARHVIEHVRIPHAVVIFGGEALNA